MLNLVVRKVTARLEKVNITAVGTNIYVPLAFKYLK
jgi:hypothetical protein